MGRFIASLLMSVDGFEGNDDFAPDGEEHQVFNDLLGRTESVVFDRECYELFVPFWDEVDVNDLSIPEFGREFAELFRARPRFVVSDTLPEVDALATLISEDPFARLREVKSGSGGDLMVGAGPVLLAQLFEHGLIDEMEILMRPVIAGNGLRQIGELAQREPLELTEVRALNTGAVFLHYRVRYPAD